MQLSADQLGGRLREGLAPVYLVSGDEPLQLMEAADAIRRAVRDAGFDERVLLLAETGFDWGELAREADSLSLFATRRLLELRLTKPRPGEAGGAALVAYAQRPPADTVLLITAPKLERDAARSAWYKALDGIGVVVRVWPLEQRALPRWIERRMRAKGLIPDRETVELIAQRVEGNLLAAAQEIDKLALLNGPGGLDPAAAAAAVADSARYDVFALVDSALAGDTGRALHILEGLRMEGQTEPIVLWALADSVRRLHTMAERMATGASLERLLGEPGLLERRKPLLRAALRQGRLAGWQRLLQGCARVDRVIKGTEGGRPWDALLALTVDLAEACAGRRAPLQPSSIDTSTGTQP